MTTQAVIPPYPKFRATYLSGTAVLPLVGGLLYTYAAGTTTPQATYTDQSEGTPNANPVVLDSNGEANVWVDDDKSYKFLLKTAAGATLWTVDNINGMAALRVDLANTSDVTLGDALIGVKQPATGAVATTQHLKNYESLNAVNDFGCDNTGASNTTTTLLAFYNACITTGKKGHIPKGTYKVTTGVLVFDHGFVDTPWPAITTAGHANVTYQVDAATATNAPVLTWKNGTANSASGKYWRGGSHGGITISDNTGATALLRSGISLTGTWGIRFGWMRMNDVRGDGITLPQNLYLGSNPDPYANSFTHFDAIEVNRAAGYTVQNLNWLGMDSWEVDRVRSVECVLGVWYGIGSGCRINDFSVASCQGWAFDDGTYVAATGGAPQRNTIHVAEFDNVNNGIRLNRSSQTRFTQVRFVHRFQTTPNATALYWPRTAISLGGGASDNCTGVYIQCVHRIEAGGVLANLGVLSTGNSSGNLSDIDLDHEYLDNEIGRAHV